MRRIKPDRDRKIFLGVKLDSAMRREMEQGSVRQRPAFRDGDPARLDVLEVDEDVFMGRLIEPGAGAENLDDLKRNIRSIVQMTFPAQRPSSALHFFPVEVEELVSTLAAAG